MQMDNLTFKHSGQIAAEENNEKTQVLEKTVREVEAAQGQIGDIVGELDGLRGRSNYGEDVGPQGRISKLRLCRSCGEAPFWPAYLPFPRLHPLSMGLFLALCASFSRLRWFLYNV